MKNSRSPKKTRLAIFDIDGTIFRSSLVIECFNALIDAGVFQREARKKVEASYVRWLNRKGHYNDYLMDLVHVFYGRLTGKQATTVRSVINRVILQQKDRVYRYTRDLIKSFKAQGYLLIAISNSPQEMVERFARAQRFDLAIGRQLEIRDGKYTGTILYRGSPFPVDAHLDKIDMLNTALERLGVIADLARSIAIGDSEGDLPLLSYVGHPIAFNPSAPLAQIAKRRSWQIIVERKDVVYAIKDTKLIPVAEPQKVAIPYGKR